jgi:hypothetical protein
MVPFLLLFPIFLPSSPFSLPLSRLPSLLLLLFSSPYLISASCHPITNGDGPACQSASGKYEFQIFHGTRIIEEMERGLVKWDLEGAKGVNL